MRPPLACLSAIKSTARRIFEEMRFAGIGGVMFSMIDTIAAWHGDGNVPKHHIGLLSGWPLGEFGKPAGAAYPSPPGGVAIVRHNPCGHDFEPDVAGYHDVTGLMDRD